jgi:CHRD domain
MHRRALRLSTTAAAVVLIGSAAGVALASDARTHPFSARLLGRNEVPKRSHGSGDVTITITGSKVCWKFTGLKGIDKPIAAHIHKGKTGHPGPVVVPLGARYTAHGCIFPSPSTAKAIEANPKGYYVNVHTRKYPDGAIRGQLHRRA